MTGAWRMNGCGFLLLALAGALAEEPIVGWRGDGTLYAIGQ